MFRKLLVIFALVVVALCAVNARLRCPPTQEWKECGSKCPATCKNPAPLCIQECVPTCGCRLGLVLKGNRCVKLSEC